MADRGQHCCLNSGTIAKSETLGGDAGGWRMGSRTSHITVTRTRDSSMGARGLGRTNTTSIQAACPAVVFGGRRTVEKPKQASTLLKGQKGASFGSSGATKEQTLKYVLPRVSTIGRETSKVRCTSSARSDPPPPQRRLARCCEHGAQHQTYW